MEHPDLPGGYWIYMYVKKIDKTEASYNHEISLIKSRVDLNLWSNEFTIFGKKQTYRFVENNYDPGESISFVEDEWFNQRKITILK